MLRTHVSIHMCYCFVKHLLNVEGDLHSLLSYFSCRICLGQFRYIGKRNIGR